MRKSIIKIYGTLIMLGITYLIIIKATDFMIPCYVYTSSGLLCPGCGITRMFLNLTEFNFYDAFLNNPVIFVLLIIWIAISVICYIGKPEFVCKSKFLYLMFYISIFSLFVFGILRNITWQNITNWSIIII